MKRNLTLFLCLALFVSAKAQTTFVCNGESMVSSAERLYVNPAMKTKEKAFTFAHVKDALRYVESTPSETLRNIYIEPSVYWIDNPDDDAVRIPEEGSAVPFGMKVKMSNVKLVGLSENPQDIILASNRGQTQGAEGNFTMFYVEGDNVQAENITFGNYCNVDLVYQRDNTLSRTKRKDAIVQAQLAICKGDNYKMRNCHFISRLNLCPFVGVENIQFDDCYFECTDDALAGTAIYNHCRFTFFSSKPFYTTHGKGARFIDCDIHTKTRGTQYLTKVSGPVSMERCRWTSEDPNLKIEWAKRADPKNVCLMSACTLNGKALDVPTPTEPLPVDLPAFEVKVQKEIIPGRWTLDCYKPFDTEKYGWEPDKSRSSWGYAEGIDGGEGSWGLVQLQRGARMMYTPKDEFAPVTKQECIVTLDPCKAPGQGFGSATGQYLDICIKFDTRSLTGYGIRFIRVPDYDHAVEAYLVEYSDGNVFRLSQRQRCDLFKPGCEVTLKADGGNLKATVKQGGAEQLFEAQMPNPNTFAGFHLQHTGSVGASATVIKSIKLK
ncbi:MAG: hypothetical protein KBT34_02100 [Prevotella sp.]|nr:hypothetical protein [Candidatus Prevotella equi]